MKKQKLIIWFFVGLMFWKIGLFGQRHEGKFPTVFNLDDINGTNGYVIDDIVAFGQVNGKGDVNGDGINDVLIGDYAGNRAKNGGQVYIIFGNKEERPQSINPLYLNDGNGVTIVSKFSLNSIGYLVSIVGDINKDGVSDILIGLNKFYVLFGKKQWPTKVVLEEIDGENGFSIDGGLYGHVSKSASGAGDINGDGFDDVIVGESRNNQGYVIFGRKNWPKKVILSDLNGIDGFVINGISNDDIGYAVSGTGDINGDGFDDVVISDPFANNTSGQSYVIFGKNVWPATIDLKNLDGTNGFIINGINKDDRSGYSVSGADDVNGDSFNDIIISDHNDQSYVIFGSNVTRPLFVYLSNLDGKNGFILYGANGGFSVSGAGDFNADNITDVVLGAYGTGGYIGQCYVIFGSKETWPTAINVSSLNGTDGFIIHRTNGSFIEHIVDGIGDVNGDGVDDILIGENHFPSAVTNSYVLFGCCGTVPSPANDYSLALGLGIGGGVVGLVALGVSSYYGYQWYHRGSYETVE